jgi:hypothetical protein
VELERLIARGARRVDVGQTGEESRDVLADPEGNEFCLVRPKASPIDQAVTGPAASPRNTA